MNHPALQPFIVNWPGFAVLIGFLALVKFLSSPKFKGWFGEAIVNRSLGRLNPQYYHRYQDLYLPRPDGKGSTQIDHVVVSPFGIFVIETKNYRGWIFGGETQRQWTQQLHRHKSRFQNPLHQNQLHVRALMDFLRLPGNCFKPVVFFIGDTTFKTPMPANVLSGGLRRWIENHRESILDPAQLEQVSTALSELDRNTDRKTAARQHLRDLRQRRAA